MKRRTPRLLRTEAELNITAFMNLMVILIPFLLITAVFSRVAVLQLNIPPPAPKQNRQDAALQLEITVRQNSIQISDRRGGLIREFHKHAPGYDYLRISKLLQQIKARTPQTRQATILAEPGIAYETLIRLMDTARTAKIARAGALDQVELFPDISLGDAPPRLEPAGKGTAETAP